METVITLAGFAGVATFVSVWVHLAADNRPLRVVLMIALACSSVLLAVGGLSIYALARDSDLFENPDVIATVSVILAITIGLPLLRPVRQFLSKFMPFDPDSLPDMVGLIVVLSMIGVFGVTSFSGGEDIEVASVNSLELVTQAAALVYIAYVGVGAFITRGLRSATQRLGIGRLTSRQLAISFGCVVLAFLVSGVAGYLTLELQPDLEARIQENLGAITENSQSVPGALILGLSAGIGEEVLFRGALQPRYGIWIVSLLFALIHVQYGLSFVLLGVFFVGVLLGVLRSRINTSAAIITHAAYNFIAVLLSMLPNGG